MRLGGAKLAGDNTGKGGGCKVRRGSSLYLQCPKSHYQKPSLIKAPQLFAINRGLSIGKGTPILRD